MAALNNFFGTSFANLIKNYSGPLSKTALVLITTGVHQLATMAMYHCPCVSPLDLPAECNITIDEMQPDCITKINYDYGLTYLLAPAIALLLIALGVNSSPCNFLTGCMYKAKLQKLNLSSLFTMSFAAFFKSLTLPATWICVALIDGQYLACSMTSLPYDVGNPGSLFETCEKVSQNNDPPVSAAFQKNKAFSQILGAICLVSLLFIGMLGYCISKCYYPLTYYQKEYSKIYREAERNKFKEEIRSKAEKAAEMNVAMFFEKKRDQSLWDRISTDFHHHRDTKNQSSYTQLHEWAMKERNHSKEKSVLTPDKGINPSGSDEFTELATNPV